MNTGGSFLGHGSGVELGVADLVSEAFRLFLLKN